MNWLQCIISSILSAVISIITVYITHHMMLKRDDKKYQHESKEKNIELNRQKEIQKAESLYKIIKPALYNAQVQAWMYSKQPYHIDYFNILRKELNNNSDTDSKELNNLMNNAKYLYHHNITLYSYLNKCIENDINSDIQDFKARYVIIENNMIVKVDIEKLNTDINTINNTLGLYIETFKEYNK